MFASAGSLLKCLRQPELGRAVSQEFNRGFLTKASPLFLQLGDCRQLQLSVITSLKIRHFVFIYTWLYLTIAFL